MINTNISMSKLAIVKSYRLKSMAPLTEQQKAENELTLRRLEVEFPKEVEAPRGPKYNTLTIN